MKNKHIKFRSAIPVLILTGLLSLGMYACDDSSGPNEPPTSEEPTDAPLSLHAAYGAWNSSTKSEFASGDQIGVYATPEKDLTGKRHANNIRFSKDENYFTSATPVNLPEPEAHLTVYHPYSVNSLAQDSEQTKVNVHTDQSNVGNYQRSDFMLGTASVLAGHLSNVRINLNRIFSNIKLELTVSPSLGTVEEIRSALVSLELNTSATVNFATSDISTVSDMAEITPYGKLTAKAEKLSGISAIVVPQQVAANHNFINVILAGKRSRYAPSEQLDLRPGMQYTLTVNIDRIGDNVVVDIAVSERPWIQGIPINGEIDEETEEIPPITDIDGNVYQVIKSGYQYWMTSNLKTTKYNDGTPITQMQDATAWSNNGLTQTPAYCYYDNNTANIELYGLLYNWYAVKTELLCPKGWKVPSAEDFAGFIDLQGGVENAGLRLKSTSGWVGFNGQSQPQYQGTNASGFDGRPGGYRYEEGNFSNVGKFGYWWTSTKNDETTALAYYLYFNNSKVVPVSPYNRTGYSVRCIRY